MKTLISCRNNHEEALFDRRFGRAEWFCIFDHDSKKADFFKNEFTGLSEGAGKNMAYKAKELGADRVISGDFGNKAKNLLDELQIQMVVISNENMTIRSVIDRIK
jgi:predicted Fe-Mo cluster-binding NifX family protein